MVLQAALAGLLTRLGAGTDIAIGSPIAGRTDAALDDLIGFFVNTLVLRTDTSGNPGFRELIGRVRATNLAAYGHADLPFERLVEVLNPARSLSRHPLFQVMLAFEAGEAGGGLELPGLAVRAQPVAVASAKFDLSVGLVERRAADGAPAGIEGVLEYASDLFDRGDRRGAGRAAHSAAGGGGGRSGSGAGGAVDPGRGRARHHPAALERHRHSLAHSLAHRRLALPGDATPATLPALFAAQAVRTPDAAAVIFEDRVLSYAALDAHANRLAHHLQSLGVGPETMVGLCVERSLEMVVGLLGILKAGGAYLPLDPDYPRERLAFMLADAGWPRAGDATGAARPAARGWRRAPAASCGSTPTARRSRDSPAPRRSSALDPRHPAYVISSASPSLAAPPLDDLHPGHLAYLIYTSGSTGRPKGAANTHAGLHNRLLWMQDAYGLTGDDVVLQKTPFSFDVSVWEFFWPLLVGARLVVAAPGAHRDPARLIETIRRRA